jgi:TonB family protein
MFDYAIDSNRGYRPTKGIVASWALSCIAHGGALLLLIQNPWLLQGGLSHHFRPLSLVSGILSSVKATQDDDWRTVAIIRSSLPMQMPPAATLRENIPDWNKTGTAPSVNVRWGTADLPVQNAPASQAPPKLESGRQPDLILPQLSAQSAGSPQIADATAAKSGTESIRPAPKIEIGDAAAGRPTMVPLPAPTKGGDLKTAIKALNEGAVSSSAGPQAETAQNSAQLLDNEQKIIRSEGSGLFDPKGGAFPLGEYADLIIERVKGNWMIPSNLRKSQGRTTVIFYIDRDGRSADARIVISSGSASLDIAALSAILGSNPFPPLPKGFPGDRVGAKFVFSYNERQ